MKPLKAKISITIDSDLLEDVKEAAESDDRSVSQFINIALKSYLSNLNVQNTEEKSRKSQ